MRASRGKFKKTSRKTTEGVPIERRNRSRVERDTGEHEEREDQRGLTTENKLPKKPKGGKKKGKNQKKREDLSRRRVRSPVLFSWAGL